MGGQACVFYGAAEFSRDTDLAILAKSENLAKLKNALEDLQATVIAVPPFEAKYLRKGPVTLPFSLMCAGSLHGHAYPYGQHRLAQPAPETISSTAAHGLIQ